MPETDHAGLASTSDNTSVEFMAPLDPDVDVENQALTAEAGDEVEPRPFALKMPESLHCYAAEAAGMGVMITIGLITNM